MDRGKRKCLVCGKEYTYCPQCGHGDAAETWRYLYDDEKCKQIFRVVSDYAFKHIDKKTAKGRLEALNLKGMMFTEDIGKQISEILAYKEKEKIVNED